jgi:hypothetical protein
MPAKADGAVSAERTITADEQRDALTGRRHSGGVTTTGPSGPDDAREITIRADAANKLMGIGTGGRGPDQLTERRVRVAYSGPTMVRYNGIEEARLNAGMLIEDLAEAAALTQRLVEQLEAADEVPAALQFQIVAAIPGADLDSVFPTTSHAAGGPDQLTVRPLPTPSRAEIAAQGERERVELQQQLAAERDAANRGRIERMLTNLQRQMTHVEARNAALGDN